MVAASQVLHGNYLLADDKPWSALLLCGLACDQGVYSQAVPVCATHMRTSCDAYCF